MRATLCARSSVALLLSLACVGPGCRSGGGGSGGGSGRPVGVTSAPIFLLAWTDPNGLIATAESLDAQSWGTRVSHGAGTREFGPAIAYDGGLNYLLMWASGPDLIVKSGVRGSDPSAPMRWDATATRVQLPGRASAGGSPALAFGLRQWVAVYPLAGTSPRALAVIRSEPLRADAWGPDPPALIGPLTRPDGSTLPTAGVGAPALAFGNLLGVPTFVLVFRAQDHSAVMATSTNGLQWRFAANLGPTVKDPALTYSNGKFYAVLSGDVGSPTADTPIIGHHDYVYKVTGPGVVTRIANIYRAPQNATAPAIAFGDCTMVVTEQVGGALGGTFVGISGRTAAANVCENPGLLQFSDDAPVRTFLVASGGPVAESVGNSGARTALAFGSATPRASQKVLVVGGMKRLGPTSFATTNQAELYDVQANTFTLLPATMRHPRRNLHSIAVANRNVLLPDGNNDTDDRISQPERFDVATGTFHLTGGAWQNPRSFPRVERLADGRVLIFDGTTDGFFSSTTTPSPAEIYDPARDSFSPTVRRPNKRLAGSATLLDSGEVLLAGGTLVEPNCDLCSSAEAHLYRPASGTLSATGNLTGPREAFTATRLEDGRVLIVGGLNIVGVLASPPFPRIRTAEVYDPRTGQFSAVGALAVGRQQHTATLLPNGMVLIAGGSDQGVGPRDNPAIATAELFDPQTNAFVPTGSMRHARELHTATLLENGLVLIVGGFNDVDPTSPARSTAELYDFRTGTFTLAPNPNLERHSHAAVAVH